MMAYDPIINPIARVSEWEIKHRPVAPPLFRRQPRRYKISTTKGPGEVEPPPGTTKLSKSYYSRITYGICGKKKRAQYEDMWQKKSDPRDKCGYGSSKYATLTGETLCDNFVPQQAQSSNDNKGFNVDIPMGQAIDDVNVSKQSQGSSSDLYFQAGSRNLQGG